MDRKGHELSQTVKVFEMSIRHYFSWPVIAYSGLYVQLVFLCGYDSITVLCMAYGQISKNVTKDWLE
jgi:hypothetical protein